MLNSRIPCSHSIDDAPDILHFRNSSFWKSQVQEPGKSISVLARWCFRYGTVESQLRIRSCSGFIIIISQITMKASLGRPGELSLPCIDSWLSDKFGASCAPRSGKAAILLKAGKAACSQVNDRAGELATRQSRMYLIVRDCYYLCMTWWMGQRRVLCLVAGSFFVEQAASRLPLPVYVLWRALISLRPANHTITFTSVTGFT